LSEPASKVIAELRQKANPENVAGMARYGIKSETALGISLPALQKVARHLGKNHALALELWDSCIHEARILAGLIADPALLSETEMEHWVSDFDSWDVCDQVCSTLFDASPLAVQKAFEWSEREEEFVRRAGFVLMAALSVHNKRMSDRDFEAFFPRIIEQSDDERNFVKKAVNWALRQIGKRDLRLNQAAIETARRIAERNSRAARWIAADALRELTSEKVQQRISKKEHPLAD
jgi:3-methyladenine DNA glycosylase AlkD